MSTYQQSTNQINKPVGCLSRGQCGKSMSYYYYHQQSIILVSRSGQAGM